jgi:hypothetical protein
MIAGRVAPKNLQQEKSHGRHRIQFAFAPLVARFLAGGANGLVLQFPAPTLFELLDDSCDASQHLKASVKNV